MTSAGHATTPELSAQLKCTVTAPLFQPAAFAAGLAVALIVGAMSSTTRIVCSADAVLPAVSVAVNVRVRTSGLAGEPAPPLLASETATVVLPQLSDAVASAATAG